MVRSAELEQLREQIAELMRRVASLEGVPAQAEVTETARSGMTEEEMIAVSAAIAAYMGVRAHIKQVRLVSTSAWAQQGRVSIQASHVLAG